MSRQTPLLSVSESGGTKSRIVRLAEYQSLDNKGSSMENKKYQIGDLAKILQISRQMIRYYEECGVIKPMRIEGNNYRLYTAMDYFSLGEAISLSQFGINIKDISALAMQDYSSQTIQYLEAFIANTTNEMKYKNLLMKRAEQIIEKTETASMNIGNIWVKKVDAHVLFPLMKSKNDVYGELVTPESVIPYLNRRDNIVFGDGLIEFNEHDEFWWVSINREYLAHLDIPQTPECRSVPAHYCLCTVMDMGSIGGFDSSVIHSFEKRAEEMGYKKDGRIYGLLLARGKENGRYHRFLEVRLPMKP